MQESKCSGHMYVVFTLLSCVKDNFYPVPPFYALDYVPTHRSTAGSLNEMLSDAICRTRPKNTYVNSPGTATIANDPMVAI